MKNIRGAPTIYAIISAEEDDLDEDSYEEPINDPQDPINANIEPMEIDEEPIRRPPRFLGDRNLVESYISHCLTNFNSYPNRFPDEGRKVLYLLNNMGGYAYEWGSKLLTRYPAFAQNSQMFIARLRNTFGDPDLEYHHQRQFRALRQHGIGHAIDYVNEFRRLAIFINTEENLLMDNFHQGLDPRLQERLDNIFPPPDNLDDLARLAVRLDRHLLQQINRRNRKQGNNSTNNTNNSRQFNRNNNHQNRNNNPHGNTNRNTPTITNRCSYCSRVGHSEDNCFRRQSDIRRQKESSSTPAAAISISKGSTDKILTGPLSSFTISNNNSELNIDCLIDTGAFASFLDKRIADVNRIHYLPDPEVSSVNGINGSSTVYGITESLPVKYGNYSSTIKFYIIDLKNYPAIVGFDWIQNNHATFSVNDEGKIILNFTPNSHSESKGSRDENFTSEPPTTELPTSELPISELSTSELHTSELPVSEIAIIDSTSERLLAIPVELMSLKEVFDEIKPNCLPPHRIYDCAIDLKPNSTPFFGPLYQLTVEEDKALKDYLDEMRAKGFIKPSKSPYGAPVMFVPKSDGTLRLVIDYRRLNQDTVRNSFPIPLVKALLDRVLGCKFFTKLDLPAAYNLVRIRDGDQFKTAFRTRYGHFEYEVMPFGLTNAPATFQFFLNDILRDVLDKFAFSYIDDILIFSKTREEHIEHVRTVLKILLDNKLYCKLKKCEFFKSNIEFLGYVISDKGVSMCKNKVQAIQEWPQPKSAKEIQQFLGLANFYRRFIKNFSELARPLSSLTRKNTPFAWSDSQEEAFIKLKDAFCSAPVLTIPDPSKPFIVETDASNFAIGAVLSQFDEENRLHPCAFMSKGLKDAETRYNIYDKELLAIIMALKEWRCHLQGAQFPFKIYCDHRNLKFPKKPEELSDRQIRWFEFLSKFNYEIIYRKGTSNKKADILSRRPDLFVGSISLMLDNSKFFDELKQAYKNDININNILIKIQNDTNTNKDYELIDNVLYCKNRIYVPKEMTTPVIERYHSSAAAGHFNSAKTEELIKRFYYWPNMTKDVENFIRSCSICASYKDKTHAPYGLVQISDTPLKPWTHVHVDLITDLPLSFGYNTVINVVDHFSKMIHLIPTECLPSAEDIANLFLKHVFRLHGLPVAITSDRGTQFTSRFWKRLLELLGIKAVYSTAHHHASNGQVERLNGIVTQTLRCLCSSDSSLWSYYLPMVEFSINNSVNSTTKMSPFEINYGFSLNFDPYVCISSARNHAELTSLDWFNHFTIIRNQIVKSKNSYVISANKSRSIGPSFNVNDYVWLNSTPSFKSGKFAPRRLGPFKIINILSPVTVELELPSGSRASPIVHIERLEKFF